MTKTVNDKSTLVSNLTNYYYGTPEVQRRIWLYFGHGLTYEQIGKIGLFKNARQTSIDGTIEKSEKNKIFLILRTTLLLSVETN